jgi:murein DD-endopeptidase MepM/ murein hydrolase activator NlpD
MAKPTDGQDGGAKHRPLPSVDMALLPHELRALRLRQLLIAVIALLLVSLVVVFSLTRQQLATSAGGTSKPSASWSANSGPGVAPGASAAGPLASAPAPTLEPRLQRDEPAQAEGTNTPAPDLEAIAAAPPSASIAAIAGTDTLSRVVRPFGQARGFRDALIKAGADGTEADALIGALDKLVDFRHGQPEHEFVFERDRVNTLLGFEYRAGITDRFRAERQPNGEFAGSRIEIAIERRRVAKGGYVSDSLGSALEALGLKNSLAGVFVEAFEGKIDFKKDVRAGDSFRVILEEEYVDGQLLGYGKVQAIQYTGARAGDGFAFWFEPDGDVGDFYDANGRALHGGWLRTPLRYDHISSGYNLRRRHPILKRIVPHHGIDYAAPSGTAVWAAADGVITFAGPRGANGNLVSIKHGNGYESYYAHLLRTARGLTRGVRVKQRQAIGAVGSTGRSTGPHLHFALKRGGRFVDPAGQLNGPGRPLPEAHQPKFKRHASELKRDLAAITLAAAPAPVAAPEQLPSEDFTEESIDL